MSACSRLAARAAAPALSLAAALAFFAAPAPALAHGTHYDCQIHHFRTYAHRHVGPSAETVICDRSRASRRGLAIAAQCEAIARRAGGRGEIVPGTKTVSTLRVNPADGAVVKAEVLNQACQRARAACEELKLVRGAPRAACQVIDRRFVE